MLAVALEQDIVQCTACPKRVCNLVGVLAFEIVTKNAKALFEDAEHTLDSLAYALKALVPRRGVVSAGNRER